MAQVYHYGKYRAEVQKNDDPEKRGRIRVLCPKVLGESLSNWCEPCIPVAYDEGGDIAVPKVGETVWVEFEEGNVNKPIYVGSWWSKEKTHTKSDYDIKTRFIEWNGCQIKMKGEEDDNSKAFIEITVGDSMIMLNEDTIEASVGDGCKLTLKSDSIEANVSGKKWTLNSEFTVSADNIHLN